jgi:hypothetical protein
MPYLNSCEGGIDGDNIIYKQLKFKESNVYFRYNDNDIVIDNITSSEQEKWTFEELDDLIHGFTIFANNYVGDNCIYGCIELIPKNSLSDNYYNN